MVLGCVTQIGVQKQKWHEEQRYKVKHLKLPEGR